MKRRDALLLIVLLCAATAASVYLFRENRALRRELLAMREAAGTERGSQPQASSGVAVEAPPRAVPDATVGGPGPDGPGGPQLRGDRRERMAQLMGRLMSDPDARQAMLGRLKSNVDRMYGPLFQRLGLDEDQAETLRTLLAESELARGQSRMLERSATTDEERAKVRADLEAQLKSINTGIESVIGADGQQLLTDYARTYAERQAVDEVARRASYAGVPLTAEASDQLAQVMTNIRQQSPVSYPGGWRGGRPQDGGGAAAPLTADSIDAYMAAKLEQDREVLRQSQAFLSAPQLEALADRQVEENDQLRAQLNFQLNNPDLPFGGPMGPGGMGGAGGFGRNRGGRPGGG